MKRLIVVFIILAAVFLFAAETPSRTADANGLSVHEWGTFTAIAGDDGIAIVWWPWNGPNDLPCFVDRFKNFAKAGFAGTVRMETPVLYFYTPRELTVNASVRFPHGLITEWFPHATSVSPEKFTSMDDLRNPGFESAIQWNNVKVSPKASPDFPVGSTSSHYYAARETDAAPIQVGDQKEKFLFYRGIANFPVPVAATVAEDGKIVVKNLGDESIWSTILFENRGGKIGFRVGGVVADRIAIEPPTLDASFASLREELEKTLIAQGLYPREAVAMVETWRESWFEEGTRLFYILPQKAVDGILPLEITPPPTHVSRVFVGRMELITPVTKEAVKQAVESGDRATLERYGRFLEPISQRIFGKIPPIVIRVYANAYSRVDVCRSR